MDLGAWAVLCASYQHFRVGQSDGLFVSPIFLNSQNILDCHDRGVRFAVISEIIRLN